MLVTRKSKNFNVSPTLNLKLDWKAALPVVDFHQRILFSMKEFLFLWLANTDVEPPFFKISWLCSTLLVPLEKIVPAWGFGWYPSNQYFRHTEIQSHACTKLTKAIWIMMFKLGGLLIFGIQEEIQTLKKSTEQI